MNADNERTASMRDWWVRFKARRLVRRVENDQWFLAWIMDSFARQDGFESFADMQEQERKRFQSRL